MTGSTIADRLETRIAGVCLIAAPLLMIPNTIFEYDEGKLFAAGIFGVLVYALLIPGLLRVARLLREPAPRLSVLSSLLATLGCVAGATFSAAMLHEWAAREAGASDAMMTSIMHVTEDRVFPILATFGLLLPISLILLSIGLFRTGVVPEWVAILLGIGAIMFPVGHIGSVQVLQHLAETLLLVPMVWIGWRFLNAAQPTGVAIPSTA